MPKKLFYWDRSLTWIATGSIAGAFGTVANFRLLGEFLGADAFGRGVLLFGLCLFTSQVTMGPVGQALARKYVDSKEPERLGELLASGSTFGITNIVLSLCIGVFAVFAGFIEQWYVLAFVVVGAAIEGQRIVCNAWLGRRLDSERLRSARFWIRR